MAPVAEEQPAGEAKRRREEVMRRSNKLKMVGFYHHSTSTWSCVSSA